MVSINRGPRSTDKSSEQQRKERLRNKQSCSLRFRKEVKVSLSPEPNWVEQEKKNETD
jgi:hypothetical protein|tara:strand:+ start:422 stop:595 length:174 start_codon:yes stop_codon:yes gene_type:complete